MTNSCYHLQSEQLEKSFMQIKMYRSTVGGTRMTTMMPLGEAQFQYETASMETPYDEKVVFETQPLQNCSVNAVLISSRQ
jgi:hypothetical protein